MTEDRSPTEPYTALRAQLHTSEFLDHVRTGVVLINVQGTVVDSNQTAPQMLGRTCEQLRSDGPFGTSIAPVDNDGVLLRRDQFPWATTLRTGEPCIGVTIGVDIPERPRRWLLVDSHPLVIDGEFVGVTIYLVDVSALRHEYRSLQLLNEVNRFVMTPTKDTDPLQSVCDVLVADGSYCLAWIGIASRDVPGKIDIHDAAGTTEYLYDGMVSSTATEAIGRGPSGLALRTGVTHVVDDIARDPTFEPWRERAAQFHLRSMLAIPFAPWGQRAILCIFSTNPYAFDDSDVRSKESIAREVEFAADQVRAKRRLEEALDGTLLSLGILTETRDPYTAGHQTRVGALGAAIAVHLGLEIKMVNLVRQAGDVHDVGKIAIPAEILTRPGRLSALEFTMIKGHTTIGHRILSNASLPWPIAEVALSHHERLDGSGYPAGLLDRDIILPARIVAVADVVEAMAHFRPYRAALGIDVALAEVAKGAGTLYDRDAVESCRAVFDMGFTFESIPTTDAQVVG